MSTTIINSLMNKVYRENDKIIKSLVPEIKRLPGCKNNGLLNHYLSGKSFYIESIKVDNQYEFEFIEKSNDFITSDDYKELTKYIKELHSIVDKNIEPFDLLSEYDRLKKLSKIEEIKDEKLIIERVKESMKSYDLVLCHNDLHPGNLFKSQDNLYIIDFDFAGNNYAMFDLVRFMDQNQLDNKTRNKVLTEYFKDIELPSDEEFRIWEDYDNLFSLVWAKAMENVIGGKEFTFIHDIKKEALENKVYYSYEYKKNL